MLRGASRHLGERSNVHEDRATSKNISAHPPSDTRLSGGRTSTTARASGGRGSLGSATWSPKADRKHADDPLHCSEYIQEIHEQFRKQEQNLDHDYQYMDRQSELNEKMRLILVDWLCEVHQKFKLHPETFFLSVNLLDRFLSKKSCPRTQLQLVGITSTLIAAKYEEIWPPELKDCTFITANTYRKEEIVEMERKIMSALNFRLTVPTVYPFLTRYLDVCDASSMLSHMASYICEAFVVQYRCLRYKPSVQAAAAIWLARLILKPSCPQYSQSWDATLQHYTKYSVEDLRECGEAMLEFLRFLPSSKYHAVRRRYSNKKFGQVSQIPIPDDLKLA